MSLLRVNCCVLALTLAILAAEVSCENYEVVVNAADAEESEERVKRQNFQASFTSDSQQRFTLVLQGMSTGLILNEPALRIISVNVNQTVRYNGASTVILTNNTMMTSYGGISTFTFWDTNGDLTQFGSGNPFPATNGPGTLFVQGSTAVFSKVGGINTQIINDVIPNLPEIIRPPSPVEVIVTNRDTAGVMNLVLNIDDTTDPPDGNAVPADDVIELTGSMAFLLSDRQSLMYTGEDLLLTTGNSISNSFRMINRFSTLLPVTRAGVSGSELRQFTSANIPTRSLQGPGVLRVGKQGGQDVAFFSNINNVNMQINMDLVDMQLEFRVTGDTTAEILARFPPSLIGERLVMLNGAQSFSYPDATSIRMEGTAVSVFSGSNLLQRFDSGTTPTVSAFLGHQIIRSMTAPMTFNIPADAGATLLFNMADNEVFVYPSRNQIIGQSISQAQANAGISPVVTTAQYSLTANEFGVATLRANVQGAVGGGVDVVQVAPGTMIVDVGNGNFISYKGMTIEILGRNGTVVSNIMGVSPLTINEQGFEYRSSPENFTATFSGPGRLYVDPDNLNGLRRAFYTGNPNIQNFITNFVNGLPEPRIDIMMDRNGNVFFQSGGMRLFDLNGASAVTAGPNMAGVYFNNQTSIVNAFDVPNNARAIYTAVDRRLRVPDPNNPTLNLFDITIPPLPSGRFWEFNGQTTTPLNINDDLTFSFMNGIIYFNPMRGALVASSNTINEGVYRILTNTGFLEASVQDIPGVTQLTVADGRSIVTYTGMSTTRLPQGGTYYISADGNSSMYINNAQFNSRVPGIYSQLNPSSSTFNRTTGVITLTTAEGNFISSLRPGITETQTIDRNGFITYAGGEITFDPEIRGRIGMISSFVVWDGFTSTTYDTNSNITFSGPGIFWFEGNTAFYTSDPTTVRRITQRIANVMTSFRPPFLSRTPRTFREKFRTVQGGFPQTIDVYEGADVLLSCTVLAANPPASISFQRRVLNMTSGQFEFETIMDGDNAVITRMGNTATLNIMNINGNDSINAFNNTGMFRCIATNIIGSDTETTTVNVRPAQAPAIVTGFLPPLEFRNNISERLITITAGGMNNRDMLSVDFTRTVTVIGISMDIVEDEQIIVRTLHIGCKGEGLPKAAIRWFNLNQTMPGEPNLGATARQLINDTERDDVLITEPRQGRSVLSISLNPTSTTCIRYICEAENRAGTALGGVDICPQFYNCEGNVMMSDCSATCGIGLATRRYTSCQLVRFTGMDIPYEQVPSGLFPLSPVLCGFQDNPPCPVISFRYGVASQTDCSVTCDVGSIMRTIVCQRIVNGVVDATVNDSFCAGQYRPSMFITCSNNPPCPLWQVGAYGPCSVTCGAGGVRMRDVMCVQPLHNETTFELILDGQNNTILVQVDEGNCTNTSRPLESIGPCNDHIPCPFRWRPENWGPCPTSPGSLQGCQQRNIICEEFLLNDYLWPGTRVNDSVCENLGLTRPHSVRSCQGFSCNFGVWMVGRGDSVCSVTCGGGGTIVQNVTCRDRQSGDILEDGFCDSRTRPKEIIPCPAEFLRSLNCPGVCELEPVFCPLIRMIGCDNPALLTQAQSCCKSCPKQATPITIPPTMVATTTP